MGLFEPSSEVADQWCAAVDGLIRARVFYGHMEMNAAGEPVWHPNPNVDMSVEAQRENNRLWMAEKVVEQSNPLKDKR